MGVQLHETCVALVDAALPSLLENYRLPQKWRVRFTPAPG